MCKCLSARLHAVGLDCSVARYPVVVGSVGHGIVDGAHERGLAGILATIGGDGECRSTARAILTVERVEAEVVGS